MLRFLDLRVDESDWLDASLSELRLHERHGRPTGNSSGYQLGITKEPLPFTPLTPAIPGILRDLAWRRELGVATTIGLKQHTAVRRESLDIRSSEFYVPMIPAELTRAPLARIRRPLRACLGCPRWYRGVA